MLVKAAAAKKICVVRVLLTQSILALNVKYQFAIIVQRSKITKKARDGRQVNAWRTANPVSKKRHWSTAMAGKKKQYVKLDDQDITKEQEKYVLKLLF